MATATAHSDGAMRPDGLMFGQKVFGLVYSSSKGKMHDTMGESKRICIKTYDLFLE